MSDKISCEVNKDTLDMLIKGLCQLRGNPLTEDSSWDEVEGTRKGRNGRSNKKNSPSDVDHRDLNAVLNKLMDTVNSLLAKQQEEQAARESIKQRIAELEERVQSQSVESDEIKQRSMKGNLILSSPPSQDKIRILKTKDELDNENISLLDHISQLIKQKYDVDLPEKDVQACHHLPNKTVILRIWNRRPGSAWSLLIDKIKRGGDKKVNFFANFQLTPQRNAISFHLRSLKKSGKISKLYTTENGAISFKRKETDSDKIKVTYFTLKKGDLPQTLTIQEIDMVVNV